MVDWSFFISVECKAVFYIVYNRWVVFFESLVLTEKGLRFLKFGNPGDFSQYNFYKSPISSLMIDTL